jgi:protein-tyrosine phosphatase
MKQAQVFLALLAALMLLDGCASPCHDFSFHEDMPGIFVGCRPRHQADFDQLRQRGIRTIISYETFTWHVAPERKKAERNKLAFVNVPVFAFPTVPSEESMEQAVRVLADASLRPVYVHCLYGRDRTAVILGLYKVYYEGATPQEAWNHMLRSGYKSNYWSLWGFNRYFWTHAAQTHMGVAEPPSNSPSGAQRPEWFAGDDATTKKEDRRKEKANTPNVQR